MQILIDNLSVEAINAALLRIQRSFKDNQASLTSNVNKIVSNTSGVSSKYDDTALRNEISALQAILFQVQQSDENQNKRLDDHEEQIDQNAQNIAVLQNLMSNIKFEYDIDTNTITFTNPSGDKVEVLLKDTTYSFAWDSETHALSIVDNFTGETIFNQVVDTFYSFSWANGVLTIADNRHDSPIAQISFDDRYYTESEIQTLILDLIPATASASNQLADKNWVNSSIETSTATFRGTYDSTDEISSVQGDNNDYLFVKTLNSSTGLYTYTKYTWVAEGGDYGHWKYAYDLNTSGFTSDQLAAINSGITSTIVENLLNGCYTGKTTHTLNTCDSWKSLLATKCGASATYCDSLDYFNTNVLANFCCGYLKANRYCFNDRTGYTNRSIDGVYSAANLGVATTCEMGICEFFCRVALCNNLRAGEKLTINYGWSNASSMRLNYPDGTSNCVSGWVVQFWPDVYSTSLWDNTKSGWYNIFAEINTLTSKRLFRIYKGSQTATCATVTEIKYANAEKATNSTCFDGLTYAQACADIRDGLTSCLGTVTGITLGSSSCSPDENGIISLPAYPPDLSNCAGLDCTGTLVPSDLDGYLKNCLATNIKVNGSNKTTVLDTISTLDNTYPKKTYQVNCSTTHCRYIYLGKLPVSSGVVSYASLTMYLFSYNCQITQSYPIGTIQIDVSSGASCAAFNIRGWSDIPLNSATSASTSPRLYVTKDATCGYYCLYLDDAYAYLKPKVQINQNTNFVVGDLSASSSMSGDSYWDSISCNDIVYLNKINRFNIDTDGNICCAGFICGCGSSLVNCVFTKANNTVSTSTGHPVWRLIYDVTAWWNCAGSSSSNTSARGIVGRLEAYRNGGYGTSALVDIEAWTNYGRGSITNPLNCSVLKLTYCYKGSNIVQPYIIKNVTADGDKYYLALKQCSYSGVPIRFDGLSYSGKWLTTQVCGVDADGTLPACWSIAISPVQCSAAALELYTTTPFIDFHAGNMTCDYTHRIIACPGTSTTTYGSLQFLTNCVSYNPTTSVYTCNQGCNFYMYPGGMFQSMKGAYFGSTSANTCSVVTIDCSSQYSIKINKNSGADKGILLTTANNCLDYCSLGIAIGSGNINRGFFDYYKASETATSPSFRWLLYANTNTWTSALQKFQIGSGSATESAGIIYGKGTCSTCPVIRFLNNTNDVNGNGYLIYSGGIGILGAGEGAGYVWCNINGSTDLYGACVGKECLYLTSDNNIYFYTNTNSADSTTWKCSYIDSSGNYYGTAIIGNSYLRTPVLMDMGVAGTPSTSKCVVIRACCTDCNCTVTARNWTFCGCDGLLYSNGFRTNSNGVSISYPKASTTYVLLGCIKQTQLDNEYQIGFYVSGNNVVNNGVLKWIGSNSGVQGQNNIEIKLSNYCNGSYGITGIGFIKTASAWNCWTCVVLRICNQHTSCAYCWNTGVYKNQIGVCGGWVESLTCLGSTAPTFDCFVDIPSGCRNFTYHNGQVCVEGDLDAPVIHTECIYSTYPAKNTSQSITFYARCCNASAIQTATMTFNPTGVLCVCRINNNGYNQKWQQTINLSSQSTNCFYPVTWPSGVTYETDIEIQSPSGSGSMAYNQNYIHFYERAGGWSDMPKTIYVQTLSRYQDSENVFGCIGYGANSAYYSVIWLRGGMNYTVNANVALTAHTENVTCGDTSNSPSTFTVGTSLCGGTNTCVGIFANATTNAGTFSNQSTYGTFYNRDGCAYILKCDVDNCGFVGHDCLVKHLALTSTSAACDRNILVMGAGFVDGCVCPVYFNNVSGKKFTFNSNDGLLRIGPIVTKTSASVTPSSGVNIGLGYMELSSATPFIDFHRNHACQDYSSRIIDGGTNGLCITVNNATGCTASTTSYTFCFLPTGVFKSPYDICSPYIRASTAIEALNFYNMTQAHGTQPSETACCPDITFTLRCRYSSGSIGFQTWSTCERCVKMCGCDGGLYATHKGCSCFNWHGIVTCQCNYSLTANTIYYIKVGRLLDGFMTGTTELDIMASGSSLVDKVNIKWLGGCANDAANVNGIEINATNYAPLKGLLGIGWVRTGTNWNCANDIYIKVCAPATATYCFGLNRTLLGCAGAAWTTGFSCTTTAPAFTCFICTKPNGARAFHWTSGTLEATCVKVGDVYQFSYTKPTNGNQPIFYGLWDITNHICNTGTQCLAGFNGKVLSMTATNTAPVEQVDVIGKITSYTDAGTLVYANRIKADYIKPAIMQCISSSTCSYYLGFILCGGCQIYSFNGFVSPHHLLTTPKIFYYNGSDARYHLDSCTGTTKGNITVVGTECIRDSNAACCLNHLVCFRTRDVVNTNYGTWTCANLAANQVTLGLPGCSTWIGLKANCSMILPIGHNNSSYIQGEIWITC